MLIPVQILHSSVLSAGLLGVNLSNSKKLLFALHVIFFFLRELPHQATKNKYTM